MLEFYSFTEVCKEKERYVNVNGIDMVILYFNDKNINIYWDY